MKYTFASRGVESVKKFFCTLHGFLPSLFCTIFYQFQVICVDLSSENAEKLNFEVENFKIIIRIMKIKDFRM